MFQNESCQINHLIFKSFFNKHYRTPKERGGREVGGFVLKGGSVLILPDYGNNSNTIEMGQQEIDVDSVSYAAGGSSLPAPVLKTEASGNTASANGKFTAKFLKAGLSGSKSWQNSYTNVSCMDINGDGYPDWINERKEEIKAQITTPTGVLSRHID